jgi:hypothetical protein
MKRNHDNRRRRRRHRRRRPICLGFGRTKSSWLASSALLLLTLTVVGTWNDFVLAAATAFILPSVLPTSVSRKAIRTPAATPETTSDAATTSIPLLLLTTAKVADLKKVLRREYRTFFCPMERDYYSETVGFNDPLTTLSGLDAYQRNVDLLAGRTTLGSILFSDARIHLHDISGGDVIGNNESDIYISDIVTRWTLSFCFKILPWKPTARFSGVSVYRVVGVPQQPVAVVDKRREQQPHEQLVIQIVQQNDFWDSINLQPDGSYQAAPKSVGLFDFMDQLRPHVLAPAAGPELPYELLRRGRDYEVRRYPSFTAAQLSYERRDEGYSELGAFTRGSFLVGLDGFII